MHWAEKSQKPPLLLTKKENQRLNWRKLANRTRHQNRKTEVFKSENQDTEPKIGQIRKTEDPNPSPCECNTFSQAIVQSHAKNRTSNMRFMKVRNKVEDDIDVNKVY